MRRTTLLVVPALTALAVTSVVGPAHAESSTVKDVARDVTYGQNGDEVPPGTDVERGTDGEPSADLRAATVVHGEDRITVVVRVRRFERGDGVTPNAVGRLRTPDGETYGVTRTASPGGGLYSVVYRETEDGGEYVCSAVGRRSAARNEISFRIERDCVGDPRWVRFGAATRNGSDDVFGELVDDARRDGAFDGGRARIGGPRVYAGTPRTTR